MDKKEIVPEFPKITMDKIALSENNYINYGKKWCVSNLIQFCKEKEYPVFDMPVAGIDLSNMPFKITNLDGFIFQAQRVNDCNLDNPIILDTLGVIADGYHRVCKAILDGKTTIKAIRMMEMPEHNSEVNQEN